MPRGGPGRGQGRKAGSRSKVVVERDRLTQEIVAKKVGASKDGLDTLIELRDICMGYAAQYQPAPPNAIPNQNADEKKFVIYVKLAGEFAAEIAEYQRPKLRAIAVALPPQTLKDERANVVDMPRDTIARSRLYQRVVNGR